jgi:hypothetical protein
MSVPAAQDPRLGFLPGGHVCAFCSGSLVDNPHYQAEQLPG